MNNDIINIFTRYFNYLFCKNEKEFINTKVINDDIDELKNLNEQVKELNLNLNIIKKKKIGEFLKLRSIKKKINEINNDIEDKEHIINEINLKIIQINKKINIYRDQIINAIYKKCIICLDKCKIPKGILNCKHEFCFECLSKWSIQKKTCPICKMHFSKIKKETEHKIDKKNDVNELKELLKLIDSL